MGILDAIALAQIHWKDGTAPTLGQLLIAKKYVEMDFKSEMRIAMMGTILIT